MTFCRARYRPLTHTTLPCTSPPTHSSTSDLLKSLNSADVFVYDPDRKSRIVFVWIGCSAIRAKKVKGREIAADLVAGKYGHRGRVLEVVEPTGSHAAKVSQVCKNGVKFWQMFGGMPSEVADVSAAGSDMLYERYVDESTHLYRLVGAELSPVRLGEVGLENALLKSRGTFFVCAGPNEMYVWSGRGASDADVEAVVVYMSSQAEERMNTDWVHAEVVQQGDETLAFKEKIISQAALVQARALKSKAHHTAALDPFALLPDPIPIDVGVGDNDDNHAEIPPHLIAAAEAVNNGEIASPAATHQQRRSITTVTTPRSADIGNGGQPASVSPTRATSVAVGLERRAPTKLKRTVVLATKGAIGIVALFEETHRGLRVVHVVPPNLAAGQTQKVFVGDCIVKVNKKPIATYRRDRLIDLLDHVDAAQPIELQLVCGVATFLQPTLIFPLRPQSNFLEKRCIL